ncbi:hypothetical protein JCM6882_002171 [Rhodosporidiobolus microsporus]
MTAANGRHKLVPLSLSSILATTSSPLPPASVCRGRIASVKPYSAHTRLAQCIITSLDENDAPGTQLEVELKGWWADKASRRFRVGEVVVLRTGTAKVLVGSRKGKEKQVGEKKRRLRFEKELSGWIVRKGGEEEVLRYKATDPRPPPSAVPTPRSAPSAQPPSAPKPAVPLAAGPDSVSGTSDNPTPANAAPLSRMLPPELTKTVPAKRAVASPPPAQPDAPLSRPAKPAKANAEGEGARSAKRRKQEEKLGWGCEASDGTVYTAFDKVGELAADATPGVNKRKVVNIIAVVHDVGEVFPPRNPDGDFYRKFTVVCPSRPSPPVELQWYCKSQAVIPDASSGDLIVARGLSVKGSPVSSSLLAASYDPIPFAVLSPTHLLSPSGPTQHPSPAPPAPECPAGVNAWAWKKGLAKDVAYGVQLDEDELRYAARVARFFRRGENAASVAPVGAKEQAAPSAIGGTTATAASDVVKAKPRVSAGGGGRPLLRIEEIEEGKFCDLIAMVIKFHNPTPSAVGSIPSNLATELYLTDYTSHPSLYNYDASSAQSLGVSLPGQHILRVSLFGYQSDPLRPLLKPGEAGGIARGALLHLRNLRVKETVSGILEATMVEETLEKYRYKRDVTVLSSGKPVLDERWREAMKGLQRRHREYWAAASSKAVKK